MASLVIGMPQTSIVKFYALPKQQTHLTYVAVDLVQGAFSYPESNPGLLPCSAHLRKCIHAFTEQLWSTGPPPLPPTVAGGHFSIN